MRTKQSDIEYWSQKFLDTSEKAAEFHQLYHEKHELDYEEQYAVMELLMDVRSYSTLLKKTLDLPDDPKPSFIKRILKK